MHLALATLLAVLAGATATQTQAGERMRYLELVNRAHDSVTSIAIAPSGDDAFRAVPLGGALHAGGGSTNIEIAGDDCRYDLRMDFRNGRTAIYRDFNVCRNRSLRIGKLPHAGETGKTAAEPLLARRSDR